MNIIANYIDLLDSTSNTRVAWWNVSSDTWEMSEFLYVNRETLYQAFKESHVIVLF